MIKKNKFIGFKVTKQEKEKIEKLARIRGLTISELMLIAINRLKEKK